MGFFRWVFLLPTLIFTHPGSRIQKQQAKRGVKIFFFIPFFVATKFSKLNIIKFLYTEEKKFGPIFQELFKFLVLFTQKIVTKLSKIWVWDPGSEIRDPEKTYSGSRIQWSKRHRIPYPGSGSATLVVRIVSRLEVLRGGLRRNVMYCVVFRSKIF